MNLIIVLLLLLIILLLLLLLAFNEDDMSRVNFIRETMQIALGSC